MFCALGKKKSKIILLRHHVINAINHSCRTLTHYSTVFLRNFLETSQKHTPALPIISLFSGFSLSSVLSFFFVSILFSLSLPSYLLWKCASEITNKKITNKNNSILSFPLFFWFYFPRVNTSCWHLTDNHALFYGISRNFWKLKYNFIERVHMIYVWHIIEVKN